MTKLESIAYLRKLKLKEKISEYFPTPAEDTEKVFRDLEEIEKKDTEHLTTPDE